MSPGGVNEMGFLGFAQSVACWPEMVVGSNHRSGRLMLQNRGVLFYRYTVIFFLLWYIPVRFSLYWYTSGLSVTSYFTEHSEQ